MRKKCRACLCCTCIKSCKCWDCKGKIKECKRYSGFRQSSIFEPQPEPKYKAAPRYPLEYYGLTDNDVAEFEKLIRSGGIYTSIASSSAHTAAPDIAEYILLSINKNLSYDGLERLWQLREIERMACCRTDFYGYRRYFYHLFDLELRRIGK